MHVFELTRALVDIESITDNEGAVGAFVHDYLARLAAAHGGHVERMDVEPDRFNVLAYWGTPLVTLRRTWTPSAHFFPPEKTTNSSGAAVRATRKASSRP